MHALHTSKMRQSTRRCGLALTLASILWLSVPTFAAAPVLLHTPDYESPVHGEPDDLLMIAGSGFERDDQVVYQAVEAGIAHPARVPSRNSADAGVAPIVQQGSPADAITVRLPNELRKNRPYRLWVVTAHNEWSEPATINDPRPQWLSPAYVYSRAAITGLGRILRVVGRNLADETHGSIQVRLQSSKTTYILDSKPANTASPLDDYVAEVSLPEFLAPGLYSVGVRRGGLAWVEPADQKLEVRPDPAPQPTFSIADPAFGSCRPDNADDDSTCFARAIEAAMRAGGGTVLIPRGKWNVSTASVNNGANSDGFILPRHVHLRGSGRDASFIVRHDSLNRRRPDALLSVTGDNSVVGIGFSDDVQFNSWTDARPVIQIGTTTGTAESAGTGAHLVSDILIADNTFMHVGFAIMDGPGRPIARLFIVGNDFGAYTNAIELPGNPGSAVIEPFRIDDSIVRGNRFVPGSYVDLTARQGPIATGIGAAHHLDFSANVADGASVENLQNPDDPNGFRAAFFWNLNNNVELTLVSANQIACSGDKDGDGEALAFDASGETYGFNGMATVVAAGTDWVTTNANLIQTQASQPVPASYYVGHWIRLVSGPGRGQTRRITRYTRDPATGAVTLHVAPVWDVTPAAHASRMIVGRQFWQVLVVGNNIEHGSPPCRKSNRTGPNGGAIVIWSSSADVVLEANHQHDANGIVFTHNYSQATASCPHCPNSTLYQTALEIRGNVVDGEYDWSIDCGQGGIWGAFSASPAPEAPPPVLGFGISISHNVVASADGLRGGAINFPMFSTPGPAPGDWPLIENLLLFHNELRDISGPPPRPKCFLGQLRRTGVRFEGKDNVRDAVFYSNRCERVDTFLLDGGKDTKRICRDTPPEPGKSNTWCECRSER